MDVPSSPSPSPRPLTTLPPPRRSVTLPLRQTLPSVRERRVSSSGPPDPRVETLYSHPSARIVAFTTSTFGKLTGQEVEGGTLPWSSNLERTIAVGQMRIYRPPGSVAFLSCGSVIKPILPKSQCWCIDEEGSKFVLLIRRPQYWRIELSMKSSNAKAESDKFKDVLLTILFFEKTACPFARGFTIQLPEPPKGPIIRRPWRPVAKRKEEVISVEEVPPGVELESADEDYSAPLEKSGLYGGDDSTATDDTNVTQKYSDFTPKLLPGQDKEESTDSLPPERPKTAPQLTIKTQNILSQTARPKSPLGQCTTSLSSSTESFHTTQCWHSPISPFPPNSASPFVDSHEESHLLPVNEEQNRTTIEPTGSPTTPGTWASPYTTEPTALVSPAPQTPTLVYPSDDDSKSVSTVSEISTPPRASRSKSPHTPITSSESKIRHRATTSSNSRRRTLSPLPSPAAMFSPQLQKQKQQQGQLQQLYRNNKFKAASQIPAMMIRKTCEILLSPPSHLINIMLSIAAKITAGEWGDGWMIWGDGDGEDLAFDVEGEIAGDGEMLDDFGYEIRRKGSLAHLGTGMGVDRSRSYRERSRSRSPVLDIPGSWEVD